jgi:hypothetical protein
MAFCCDTPVAINIKETFIFFQFVLVFVSCIAFRGRKVLIIFLLDWPSLLWWW